MLFARALGALGRLLIWTGSIVLLFVAYQLWGTSIAEARAQDDLASEFQEQLSTVAPPAGAEPDGPAPTPTTTPAPPPPPDDGEAVARLVIPAIGLDKIVVEGVSRGDLRKAPGHYPDTPLPGQPGNAAVAGHRTTYGAPFQDVDELVAGDEILVTTLQGSFRYEVTGLQIVAPGDVHVVDDQGDDRLTLTSCHPEYSARQRIVVTAALVDEPAPAPDPTVSAQEPLRGRPEGGSGAGRDTDAPDGDAGDGEGLQVLDGDERGPLGPAIAWGAVVLAVWIAVYVLSRRWRRIPAYVLGAPVFAGTLFVFFEAVADTLPANF